MKRHREPSAVPYIIGGAVVVGIIFAVAFYFGRSPREAATAEVPLAPQGESRVVAEGDAVTVMYSASGFSPNTVTIKRGESVKFVDQDTGKMWVGSNPHPDHTGYAGTARPVHCARPTDTAFDQCGTTPTYSFTFEKTGTWKYHNHVIASHGGTVVVTE